MWMVHITVITVFAGWGTMESNIPPAGKCDTRNIYTVPLPITQMEKYPKWRILYTTDFKFIEDHESILVMPLGGENYIMTSKRVLKDHSELKYTFRMTYIDTVFSEDTEDSNGNPHRFYMYPLKITRSLAMYIYRCSDVGYPGEYDRFITAPVGSIPSESEIQEIFALDKATFGNNHGSMVRLPEEIDE